MSRLEDRLAKLEAQRGKPCDMPQIFLLKSQRSEDEIIGVELNNGLFKRLPGESFDNLQARAAAEASKAGMQALVTFAVYAGDDRPA